ncbi:MAG: hypothetical protein O9340_06015 [Cyclobacteriaceae bacterium]|nr:hypothetical protein [Cyclobacteriaceae bacterium]
MNDIKISKLLLTAIKSEIPLLKDDKVPSGFSETIDLMFSDGNIELDRERFNILANNWNLPPINNEFFNRYFPVTIVSVQEFKAGLDKFIVDALWHFGDLRRAYLSLSDMVGIESYFNEHSFHVEELKGRLPWSLVEQINPSDRGFLGYVSGQRPKHQQELLGFAELVVTELEENSSSYVDLSSQEISQRILEKLSKKKPEIKNKIEEFNKLKEIKNLDLFSSSELESTKIVLADFRKQISETIEKIELLKEIGKRNQEHYLRNIESIDVYVATSMRNDAEYHDMYNFVEETFKDEKIQSLNLRYFDPTLCYCESRIDKGVIECLLVRSSKVTIYCAQEGDTFGKDSELAATMAQGKPVIVYVPIPKITDIDIAEIENENEKLAKLATKKETLEKRAKTFKDFHPLGLQVGLYDGVARGVIVVRTPEECSKILYKILTNSLDVDIRYEQHGIVLRERETNSVVRVMTGWGVLAHCFWNQFDKTQNPKAGLPS